MNAAPILEIPPAQFAWEGEMISIPINATDPEDAPLTYSATDLPIGISIDQTTGILWGNMAFTNASPSSWVELTSVISVTDGTNLVSAPLSWTIFDMTPNWAVPRLNAPAIVNGTEDASLSISGVAFEIDSSVSAPTDVLHIDDLVELTLFAEASTLTVLTNVAGGLTPADVQDNGSETITITATIGAINTTFAAANALTYLGPQNYFGQDSLLFSVSGIDNLPDGIAVASEITLANAPDAPMAKDDLFIVPQNQISALKVLDNDFDADFEGVTISAVAVPTSGIVSIAADGKSLLYQPNANFRGVETFSYTIVDEAGLLSVATVEITVANGRWAQRVESVSSELALDVYDWRAVQVLGVPGDVLSGDRTTLWVPSQKDNGLQTITVSFDGLTPAVGFVIREAGSTGFVRKVEWFDFTGTPHIAWEGVGPTSTDGVRDFRLLLSEATSYDVAAMRVTIDTDHVVEGWEGIDAIRLLTPNEVQLPSTTPNVTADVISTDEDTVAQIDVRSNDIIANQSFLRIAIEPLHGTVAVRSNDTPLDLSDDYLVYVPSEDYSGTDSLSYSVIDLTGQVLTTTVTITVIAKNDAPLISDWEVELEQGTEVEIPVLADVSDIEGHGYSLGILTQPTNGTVTLNDAGTPSDASDDVFVYLANSGFVGTDSFSYSVTDSQGAAETSTLNVRTVAQAMNPVFTARQKEKEKPKPVDRVVTGDNLSWSDFTRRDRPPVGKTFDAYSWLQMRGKLLEDKVKFNATLTATDKVTSRWSATVEATAGKDAVRFTATWDKKDSWVVVGKESEKLLKHEKIHVLMATRVAQLAQKNWVAKTVSANGYGDTKEAAIKAAKAAALIKLRAEVAAHADTMWNLAKALHVKYDSNEETNHGNNADAQKHWEDEWQSKVDNYCQQQENWEP